jgi:hypothetical protein
MRFFWLTFFYVVGVFAFGIVLVLRGHWIAACIIVALTLPSFSMRSKNP